MITEDKIINKDIIHDKNNVLIVDLIIVEVKIKNGIKKLKDMVIKDFICRIENEEHKDINLYNKDKLEKILKDKGVKKWYIKSIIVTKELKNL